MPGLADPPATGQAEGSPIQPDPNLPLHMPLKANAPGTSPGVVLPYGYDFRLKNPAVSLLYEDTNTSDNFFYGPYRYGEPIHGKCETAIEHIVVATRKLIGGKYPHLIDIFEPLVNDFGTWFQRPHSSRASDPKLNTDEAKTKCFNAADRLISALREHLTLEELMGLNEYKIFVRSDRYEQTAPAGPSTGTHGYAHKLGDSRLTYMSQEEYEGAVMREAKKTLTTTRTILDIISQNKKPVVLSGIELTGPLYLEGLTVMDPLAQLSEAERKGFWEEVSGANEWQEADRLLGEAEGVDTVDSSTGLEDDKTFYLRDRAAWLKLQAELGVAKKWLDEGRIEHYYTFKPIYVPSTQKELRRTEIEVPPVTQKVLTILYPVLEAAGADHIIVDGDAQNSDFNRAFEFLESWRKISLPQTGMFGSVLMMNPVSDPRGERTQVIAGDAPVSDRINLTYLSANELGRVVVSNDGPAHKRVCFHDDSEEMSGYRFTPGFPGGGMERETCAQTLIFNERGELTTMANDFREKVRAYVVESMQAAV